MRNSRLETIFNSNYPIDCHIVKGRLETEGIDCFVYDENIISVYPFWSVSVGGVKLKVSSDQTEKAKLILQMINNHLLVDENGEYEMIEIFKNEIARQDILLNLRKSFQHNPELLSNKTEVKKTLDSKWFSETEKEEVISNETEFFHYNNLRFKFIWKEFWYELFDFERSFFKYLRIKPNRFYLEKDILDNFAEIDKEKISERNIECPKCNSTNVKFGHAMDYKYDILYLVLSVLISPFPPFRKKYFCFDCGHSFKQIVKSDNC